jgi:sulfate permease, SulP family
MSLKAVHEGRIMTTATVQRAGPARGLSRFLPILTWLPGYQRGWLRGDFIAGLTILALLIPEGMAYAELAGLPPQTAFYAAPIGLLLYAIFGTSRQLMVAVSAVIATMSAAAVAPLAAAGSTEYAVYSAALALLAGIISVLAGLFKLGRIASFFSESVLVGFITGLALTVAIKQVPKLFGIESGHGNFWERLYDILIHLPETHLLTLIVGVLSIALLLLMERRFHKIPAALVVMIVGIAGSALFGLAARGVHVVGEIPAGFVPPKIPDVTLQDLWLLLPGALGIALVNFAEAYGPARGFAGKHKYEIDANQELIGLGAANMGAGLFQGFSIGSSLSKSAANDRAGAKTPVSLLVCAGLTVIVALFLTPLFAPLPEAVLGAVVIVAVIGMMKFKQMRHLWDMRRVDFWLAMVALFGVLTFEALEGLLIAVIISLAALVWRASQPRFSVLGRTPTSLEFSDIAQYPENKLIPGLLIIRPNQSLFFANADSLRAAIVDFVRASDPPARAVLLDLEMTSEVDMPGAEMLAELKEKLTGEQVDLLLSRVRHPVRDLLDRSGVTQQLGAENFHLRTIDGMLAYMGKYHEQLGAEYETFVEGLRSLLVTLDAQIAHAEGREKELLTASRTRLEGMARKVGAI